MRTSMFALAGFVAAATGCGDDNNVPDAQVIDAKIPDAAPPPAALSLSPLTADFGSVTIGMTSDTKTFTVMNTGGSSTGSISTQIMGSAAANFSIETNGCTTLAAGANCTITVSFSPQDPAGAKSANLQVSAGGSVVTAALDGIALSTDNLTSSPTSNAFADTVVGQTSASSATFTIKNNGGTATSALTVQSSGSSPGDFVKGADTCSGMTVAAGATCSVTVSFKPTSAGDKSASFTVASGTNAVNIPVTGKGIADAKLVVVPSLQDFGTVASTQSSSTVTFTVSNIGGVASGAITQTLGGADAGQFSVVSSSCSGATVAPGMSCVVGVKFSPTGTGGARAATLTFAATPGQSAVATLLGTAQSVPGITPNPSSLTFANTTVGQTSATQTVVITNTGGSPTGALTTSLSGTNPDQYTIVAGSNGCQGAVLAANGTCNIVVSFTPNSGGAKSASLTVVGAPGGTAIVGLNGNAIPDAHFAIAPASHDFGAVGIGTNSSFFTFTVTNDGGQTSGVPNVVLGGANATQFSIQNGCTMALVAGGTCTVQARFSPNIAGSDTATITVSGTPGGSAVANLFGQGVTPAALVASSPTLGFNGLDTTSGGPATLIGNTVTNTFNLTNTGTEPTGMITIAKQGANQADFSFTSNCTTLPMNMSCTVTVTFTPTTSGTETALLVASATPGGSTSVVLSGDVLPRLQVDPTSKDFGGTIVNSSFSNQQVFTFTNNTKTTQTLSAAVLSDTTNYTIVSNGCTAPLVSNDSCDIVVNFKPTTTGTKAATLVESIGAGGANNTATATLSGVGINSLTIQGTPAGNITCTGSIPNQTCDFGSVPLGTSSQTLTATVKLPAGSPDANSISTTLTNTDFQIVQDNCAGVKLQTAGTTQCTILLRLQPTGAAGARTADLTATASPSGGTATLHLTATVVTGASLTIAPTTLDFGTIVSGTTKTSNITVTNTGGATSGTLTFSLTGSNYSVATPAVAGDCVSNTTTLAPAASCVVRVVYSPVSQAQATTAAQLGTVVFSTNGAGIPTPTTVNLTGKNSPSISIVATPAGSNAIGDVAVGSVTNLVFTLTNNSSHAVTPGAATIGGGGEATITMNNCTGVSIAAAGTCTINVQFAPTASGTYSDQLQVLETNGIARINVTARALTAANFTFTPATADLGSALAGSANGGTQVYTLTNNGQTAGNSTLVTTGASADFTQTTTCGATLAPAASCTVTVKFTPPAGETTGAKTVTITTGGKSVTATGTVVNTGGFLITPSTQGFDDTVSGATSAAHTFTIVNSAATAQTIAPALAGTDAGQFAISANTCPVGPATLAAGGQCTVTVVFKPTSAGLKQAQVATGSGYAAISGKGLGPAALALNGRATATGAINCANCTTFNYGTTAVGDTVNEIYTVTNSGDVASAALTTSVDGNDPTQFVVSANGCNGTAVAPGASCSVTVSYKPTQVGNKTATFHVGAFNVALSGNGVSQAILGITPSAPQTLPDQPVGHAAGFVDFSIHNGGDVATSSNLDISLDNTKDYTFGVAPAVTNCVTNAPLAANGTCIVRVLFAPTTLGSDKTTLTVSASVGAAGTSTVTNTITANGLTNITVSPASSDFGTVAAGSASATATTITFSNAADSQSGILHTVLGGTGATSFSIIQDNCTGQTLAATGMANSTCTISVKFTPQTAGAKTATIVLEGAAGTPTATLNGTAN